MKKKTKKKTAHLDTVDDGAEARLREHNISSSARSVSGTLDSDTHICALERRCVIDSISSHTHRVAALAQGLDDEELVLRVDLKKRRNLEAEH